MALPLTILAAAIAAMGIIAFGADPRWAVYDHGVQFIMLSRRLESPLAAIALICCLILCAMVVAGSWRAWWLFGLAPILVLLVHHCLIDPARGMQVDADAQFVSADKATLIHDNDCVVGLNFDGESYAYPFNVLFEYPIVAQAKPRTRLLLIWSAYANRAVAVESDWTVKPRELEVVSQPADSLLIYNSRLGQFINGVTGLTPGGERPSGFGSEMPTVKMTWKTWHSLHPQTFVLQPPPGYVAGAPTGPIAPMYHLPFQPDRLPSTDRVALIGGQHPMLVKESDIGAAPLNLIVAGEPVLMFRDSSGGIKAYLRQANGDLIPRFIPASIANHPNVFLTEHDSNSWWADDGRALDGPLKGEKLKPYDVDEGVYLDVVRFWFPHAPLIEPKASDIGQSPPPTAAPRRRSSTRHRATNGASRRVTLPKSVKQSSHAAAVTASF